MIIKNKILAIIPARLGSRRLKRKNILKFCGKPLIYWTIKEASKSRYIDKCIVSTESTLIANISKRFGADVPFMRPKKLSNHKSSSNHVVIHAIRKIKERFDYIILLQPTSPLRTSTDIDKALFFAISKRHSFCVGVTKNEYPHNWYVKVDKSGNVVSNFNIKKTNSRFENTFYKVNGSIYIAKIKDFLKNKTFFTKKTKAYKMKNDNSLDIDSKFDFQMAEAIFKREN